MHAKDASFRKGAQARGAARRSCGKPLYAAPIHFCSAIEAERTCCSRLPFGLSALVVAVCIGFSGTASTEDKKDKGAEKTGGVYKCVAANGSVTYSTSACKGAKREFLTDKELKKKSNTVRLPKPPADYPVYQDSGTGRPAPAPTESKPGRPDAVITPMGTIIHDPDIGR
jgi:hypothetical protein